MACTRLGSERAASWRAVLLHRQDRDEGAGGVYPDETHLSVWRTVPLWLGGPSVWHRDHLGPCMRELRPSNGPLAGCTDGEHQSTNRMPGTVPSAWRHTR
ncbi:DUF4913 domain-containing protein [Streptomyces pharetrae]